jgi:bifunctional non-homologous end joining protein LigD
VKYDGFRALCFLEQGRCRLISRNGNSLHRFALGAAVAAALAVAEAVLDGELIMADESGRPQFYDLLSGRGAPAYVAFDLLWLDGIDLRPLPLRARRRQLRDLLPKGSPTITEAVSVEGRGCELYRLVCEYDLEGIVAKCLADPYGPRTRWWKIKNSDYSQKEGRGETGHGNAQRIRQDCGELLHGARHGRPKSVA